MMRAATVRDPGGPEAIRIVDAPSPRPGAGEIRVRVQAAAVNPVDLQTRSGVYHRLGWVHTAEVGLGWDVAGVVDLVGPEVTGFRVGDRVAAMSAGVDRALGAYAEQAVVPVGAAARLPEGMSAAVAATVPLSGTTAAQALELLGAAAGRNLLVTGAAGAVGDVASRLAGSLGWTVTGLARTGDEMRVRAAGARFVPALPSAPVFDAVLDAAAIGVAALTAVTDAGAYVGVIPIAIPPSERSIDVQAVLASPDGAVLDRLLTAAADGMLRPRVHSVLPLAEAAHAHRLMQAGGVRGRIVLAP